VQKSLVIDKSSTKIMELGKLHSFITHNRHDGQRRRGLGR
jgi:hypothetical protein